MLKLITLIIQYYCYNAKLSPDQIYLLGGGGGGGGWLAECSLSVCHSECVMTGHHSPVRLYRHCHFLPVLSTTVPTLYAYTGLTCQGW